jgi:hypothetical protein
MNELLLEQLSDAEKIVFQVELERLQNLKSKLPERITKEILEKHAYGEAKRICKSSVFTYMERYAALKKPKYENNIKR